VELCAFKQHLSIIYYLLSVQPDDRDKLAIWCRLVKMARRHTDIDAVVAFRTLKLMTEPPPEPTSDVEDDHDQGRDQGDDQGHDQGQGHVGQGEGGEEEGVPAVNASWKRVHACNFEKIVKLQLASNICDEAKVTYLFIHLFIHPSVHPSIHPFIHPSVHPSSHPFIHPFIHLFYFLLFVSICLCPSHSLKSICPSACLCLSISVYLPVCLIFYLLLRNCVDTFTSKNR